MRLFRIVVGNIQYRCHGCAEFALRLRQAKIGGTRQRKEFVDFQLGQGSSAGSIADHGVNGWLHIRAAVSVLQIVLGETVWHNRNQINIIRCDSLLQ